jgi:hypothetical protein
MTPRRAFASAPATRPHHQVRQSPVALGLGRAEFSLTVLAYDLKRVLNILSFAALMKAVQSPA